MITDRTDFKNFVKVLKSQFLSCYSVSSINWDKFNEITWEQQEEILENTLENKLNQKFPLRNSYQLMFLKKMIEYMELYNIEIHDRVYELYCDLKCKPHEENKLAYKHYLPPENDIHISLKELKSFVTSGTTGLCSWQASLALSNWILNNPKVINNKIILELGAGTGLCSFTTLKYCLPKEVMITDGSIKVLDLLNTNLTSNFNNLKITETNNDYKKFCTENGNFISTFLFPWEEVENLNLQNIISPDIILAADVVYDNSIFESLSDTIGYIFDYMNNKCELYLAATVRNTKTLNEFLQILERKNFIAKILIYQNDEKFFYWDNTTPINIYCISKSGLELS